MPKFTTLLSSLESFIERAGGPQSILTTLHRVKMKSLAWHGEGDAPSWLVTADEESVRALLLWRSELVLADADRHAELAAKILSAVKRMRQSLSSEVVDLAAEPAMPPPQRTIRRLTITPQPISLILGIGGTVHTLRIAPTVASDTRDNALAVLQNLLRNAVDSEFLPKGSLPQQAAATEFGHSIRALAELGLLERAGAA